MNAREIVEAIDRIENAGMEIGRIYRHNGEYKFSLYGANPFDDSIILTIWDAKQVPYLLGEESLVNAFLVVDYSSEITEVKAANIDDKWWYPPENSYKYIDKSDGIYATKQGAIVAAKGVIQSKINEATDYLNDLQKHMASLEESQVK